MPKTVKVPAFSKPQGGRAFYRSFRGIDLSGDETMIDSSRSPHAVNMVSDEGGFPEKRIGWRTIYRFSAGEISGIWPWEADGTEKQVFVVHVGDKLIKLTEGKKTGDYQSEYTETELRTGLKKGAVSQGFYMNGKLYILTGAEYLVFDGKEAKPVREVAHVPTTTISAQPTGGGVAYEKVNMLTPKRINMFIGNGSATQFKLDATNIDSSEVTAKVNGNTVTVSSVNRTNGLVTLASAPPDGAGLSNVSISFAKTVEGHAENIEKCTIFALYGVDNSNRVFIAGNPDKPNAEWYSGLADPSYFPDLNYSLVGSSEFPIMCFVKFNGELMIIKADNRQEGTIWNHTSEMTADGVAVFPLKEGVSGYGAVARYSSASLLDDPLYLTPRGVFAPTITFAVNYVQKGMVCRSRRINARLCKEAKLKDAIADVWKGLYLLAIDGHVYVADGNQSREHGNYEWFYWDNIPARVLKSHGQSLFFGTADGRLCRLNDDIIDFEGKPRMIAYNDDGAPIRAEWWTKLDSMDSPQRLKTMPKQGSGVHLKAYQKSRGRLYIRTQQDPPDGRLLMNLNPSMFSFIDFDFNQFSFNTNDQNMIPFRTKEKNWKAIQIGIVMDELNQAFGVFGVEIRYLISKYAKR